MKAVQYFFSSKFLTITILAAILPFLACMNAAQHSESLHSSNDRNMTLGIVQKSIYRGMSQAAVAESLGSPNIVSKDNSNDETWIYDKIATEASYSSDSGGIGGGIGAGGAIGSALLLGLGTGSYNKQAGASASTQRTLTVVIKFDKTQKVKDFSYHTSKF